MSDKTFGLVTFLAGMVFLGAAIVLTAHSPPERIDCEEDEVVITLNGVTHDTCQNVEEFIKQNGLTSRKGER